MGEEFHRNRRDVAVGIKDAYTSFRVATKVYGDAVKAFGGDGRYDETTARVKELVNPLLEQIVDGLDELERTTRTAST